MKLFTMTEPESRSKKKNARSLRKHFMQRKGKRRKSTRKKR